MGGDEDKDKRLRYFYRWMEWLTNGKLCTVVWMMCERREEEVGMKGGRKKREGLERGSRMRGLREVLPFCLNLIGLLDCRVTLASKSKVKSALKSKCCTPPNVKTNVFLFLIFQGILHSKLNQALFHFDSTLNANLYECRLLD